MKFLVALKYLTTIPLPLRRQSGFEEMGGSSLFFPLVGLLIGLFLASLSWLLKLLLPAALVNVLVVSALVAITGARHLDGLAHTADGLVGHATREARLEITGDKRTGSFGIIAVAALLLLKYIALDSLPQGLWLATLIYMPVLGRWAMVYAIFSFQSARPSGLDGDFKRGTRWYGLLVATLTALAVTFALARLPGLVVMLGVLVAVTILALYLRGRFGGLTVAAYGATGEFAEAVTLVMVSLLVYLGLA
ncbi:MAG: adenosylcobinamide-GDP ribazoletransferase [Chloroflexota bacterium]